MQCEKKRKCSCGEEIVQTTEHEKIRMYIEEPYHCNVCFFGFSEEEMVCNGKIKKVWSENGEKIIDCICEKCGASYGRDAIAREVLLEKFSAV